MKKFVFLALFLMNVTALGEIRELSSYKDFKETLAADTWVIFDIDNTLIAPKTMIGSHQWGDYMRDQKVALGSSVVEATLFQHQAFEAVQSSVPVKDTEAEAHELIAQLNSQRVPNFALTARASLLKPVTIRQLSSLAYDFSSSFPTGTLSHEYVEKGVVFSGSNPKGELVKRMIKAARVTPKHIVFFDDRRYNLESVEKELAGSGVDFIGYRYGGVDEDVKAFRPDIANVQWAMFKMKKRVVEDSKLKAKLFSLDPL